MALTKIPGNLIETGAITAAALDNDAVTTAKILDANITHAKLHTSMDLTGKTVTVATAAGSTNTTAAASTAFVQQELTTLIGGAPGTLDTLNELAAAINDDSNYNTTLTTALATKLPLAGGTLTGNLSIGAGTPGDITLKVHSNDSDDYIAIFKQTHASNLGTVQIDTPSDSNARPSRLDFARGGVNKWKTGMVYGDTTNGWGLSDATGSGTALQQTRFLVTPTGNVGIGTTPTAWSSGYKSLQIGDRGFVGAHSGSDLYVGQNAYFNSGWKYEASTAASLTQHSGGQITHYVTPAGTAGNAITWNIGMHIKPTGEVGIGTTSPEAALEVNRNGAPFAAIIGAPQGSGRVIQFKDNHASPTKYNWVVGSQFNVNDAFEITPSTAVGGDTHNTPAITVLPSGLVGIGTTNPTGYRLVVENTSEDLLKLHNSTNGLDSLISFTNPGGTLGRVQGIDNGGLGFDVGNNAGGIISNAIRIDNTGNVGIGTTDTGGRLTIQTADGTTNSAVNSLMIRNMSSNTTTTGFGGEIRFQAQRNNGAVQNTGGIRSVAEVNSGANISSGLSFWTSAVGVIDEKVRISYDGNVGIGDTSPSAKLSVGAGNASTFVHINNAASGDVSSGYNIMSGSTTTTSLYGNADEGWTTLMSGGSLGFRVNQAVSGFNPMNIDTSGRVTMPYQPAWGARSLSNANSSGGTSNTNEVLVFSTAMYNVGNHYSNSTGLFTVPVAGRYFVTFSGLYNLNDNTTGPAYIRVNTAEKYRGYHHNSGSSYIQISMSGVVDVSVGDTINIYAVNDGWHIGGETSFSGFLIG
jgi:hypothetical protein